MKKGEIAAALEEMADLMEVRGENPFRVRSFRNGARALEGITDDLASRVAAGDLARVPGIGKTLAELIGEMVLTGRSSRLEELRQDVPSGVLDLVAIPGLGPKKARILHEKLGIAGIDELERACEEGRVSGLPGFGEKSVQKIRAGIAYRRTVSGRFLVVQALDVAEPLRDYLATAPEVVRVEIAGSLRRRRETVKDVDFIASVTAASDAGRVMEHYLSWKGIREVLARGETKSSVRLRSGIQADLRVVEDRAFAPALQYFTGSKEHNVALRGLAREHGLTLNEYGLFPVAGSREEATPCPDEAALYAALGLDWIPPELREDQGEIELARRHLLPDLVAGRDLRGVVHVHTTYSDGKHTLEEMAEAARGLGFEYLGVSDHSQSAGYAGGLKEDAVRRQHDEIDGLNEKYRDFRIFKGIESDIRADGSLDYPEHILDLFDFVIAAVHSSFQLSGEEQTRRVIRALEDPHTTFLAHPTGRLLLDRDSYELDMERVLETAGRLGVAVEINAHPRRLDLDWRWGKFAREHGVRTAIHPDAHAITGYEDIHFGVGIARKAGFTAADVVNTYGPGEFRRFLATRRR